MLLYTFALFVFFIFVFILCWKLPRKFQWILLLIASYYFYASWKPAYLILVLITTIATYSCAIGIARYKNYKKLLLLLALAIDLGLLFIFKYFNFFGLTINQLFHVSIPEFKALLPIGISFYTLQVIGYLIDVYKGNVKPEKHLGYFALFACFFPNVSSGPIERSTTLLPQLRKERTFDYNQIAEGARLFMIGLFKKLVIADNLGIIVDRGFGSLDQFRGISLILIVFFYTWQIYMDFSGYTDMARGIGKMVGINLLENFNLPYLANSVQDFWRRWHISFSSWLREYVYFSLGGNRKGFLRTIINIMIVFTLSGLWHGAAWTFVVWGFLHGFTMSLERILKRIFGTRVSIPNLFRVIYAYCAISVFWVFFRSPTIHDAIYILRNSFVGFKHFASPSYLWASLQQLFAFDSPEIIITFGIIITAISIELLRSKVSLLKFLDHQPIIVRYTIYMIIVFLILQLRDAYIKEFIYVQF
jgi:alginate O-acetyltransferase complex protein AlgI